MADGHFRPFPVTRFGPWAPETGPNGVFAHETPQSYGKRVAWVHPARPARRSFWVSGQKCMSHFGPLGPEKQPKRPVSGHRQLRQHQNCCPSSHRNFPVVTLKRHIHAASPFFAENPLSSSDENVFTGLCRSTPTGQIYKLRFSYLNIARGTMDPGY